MKNKYINLVVLLTSISCFSVSYAVSMDPPVLNNTNPSMLDIPASKIGIDPSNINHVKARKISAKLYAEGVILAQNAMKQDPFSESSIWNPDYFAKNESTAEVIKKFIKKEYASKLNLVLAKEFVSKDDLEKFLIANGFSQKEQSDKDRNHRDSGKIFVAEDGSMVRIKDYKKSRKLRPQEHYVLSVIKNPEGPTSWQNEAFKLSKSGFVIPKAPKLEHGLKTKSANLQNNNVLKGWIDLIMEEAHIDFADKK
jgi:hypothetical protein